MTTSSGYPEPGEMLGGYRVIRRLGQGGMGVVFEAEDVALNRRVALKVISPHISDDTSFQERFVREAQAQASVNSRNVVSVYSFGESEGRLYIATQLVDSGDLGKMIHENGRPPLSTALDLIAQVAQGLADAHKAGLVHRDIKPANVLLSRRDDSVQAYLGDFGIARQVGTESQLTVAGGTVGTPSYMAPELHTGIQAGVQSDVYSLGCLLWATITGHPPFSGGSEFQIIQAHLEKPVPQVQPGSPAADAVNLVLRYALAKQPQDRYPSAGAMARDLAEAERIVRASGVTQVSPSDETARVMPAPDPTSRGSRGSLGSQPSHPSRPGGYPNQPSHPSRPGLYSSQDGTQAPPPGSQYHFSGGTPLMTRPSPSATKKQGNLWWISIAVLLVVAIVVGVVVLTTRGDDGDNKADDPSGNETTSEGPTDTTTSPNGIVSGGDPSPLDPSPLNAEYTPEQLGKAASSMEDALLEQDSTIDRPTAACMAREWINESGMQKMIDAGVYDEDLNFQPEANLQGDPSLASGLLTASLSCAFAGLETAFPTDTAT